MKRYFIIGTDTDCGKTYVSCQLLKHWQDQGHRVRALKPVASGCVEQNDRLVSEDAQHLQAYNRGFDGAVCPWLFKEPIAPHLAAKAAGVQLSAHAIAAFCTADIHHDLDYLLIEGAGGLMVPLNEDEPWLDVLRLTAIPVILVVGMRLGCINHALLTAFALKMHGIACAGWIANEIDPEMLELEANIDALSERIEVPLLGRVAYLAEYLSLKHVKPCNCRNASEQKYYVRPILYDKERCHADP